MSRLLVGCAAAALLLALPAARAAEIQPPHITVTGEGQVAVAPDMAVLSLTVMREEKTAREALDANTAAMNAVIAAMKEAGVADRDLQTANFQINPRYDYDANRTQQSTLVGYQVSNTLSVRVRDLPKTGALLDKAVSVGVNQGGSISFTNADPDKPLAEARKKAVADAIARARTLTEAAGVKLGAVTEIAEQSAASAPAPITARAFDAAAAPVPVEAGENSYSVQVTVTFALE